jgi:hypothetical protein
MNADLALMVGVMLGPGGVSMLQSPDRRRGERIELCERVAMLEQIAAGPRR